MARLVIKWSLMKLDDDYYGFMRPFFIINSKNKTIRLDS